LPTSSSSAVWEGGLRTGRGHFTAASGAFGGDYSFRTRFEGEKGTNPEELIAAAHAACYAMAFSHTLAEAGSPAERLAVDAVCHFTPIESGGFALSRMDLDVHGSVPGIDQDAFERLAREGEHGCPVSNALRGNVEIELTATLDR